MPLLQAATLVFLLFGAVLMEAAGFGDAVQEAATFAVAGCAGLAALLRATAFARAAATGGTRAACMRGLCLHRTGLCSRATRWWVWSKIAACSPGSWSFGEQAS